MLALRLKSSVKILIPHWNITKKRARKIERMDAKAEGQRKTQRFLKKPNGFLMGKIKTQRNPTKPNETQKTEERREKSEERSQKKEDRSQKTEGEAEGEAEAEERSQSAHTDADSDADVVIRNYFADKVGREPSREFVRSAGQTGLSVGYICAAIDKSTGANVPEGYATNILRRWASDGVPSNVHPVTVPNAPLEPWEQDWLAEYRAMTKEQEEQHDNDGNYQSAELAD